MKRLIVCPEHELEDVAVRHRVEHLIQLTGPEKKANWPDVFSGRVLHLAFNDINEPRSGLVAPKREDIEALLGFAESWQQGIMVCQCWMGISRSTAAALLLALSHGSERDPTALAFRLRQAAPSATPNALMIAHGDDLLGMNGRLRKAVAEIGRGADAPHGTAFEMPLGLS